jgi:asparagine synthase (glutamine-hydrolysing)
VSGFAGVVSLDGAPPDENLVKRMADRLAFRGPDGTRIWKQPGAGFVFTFLRTGPAPQCPSQPCSLDGKVWLLGDVRLDGRDDLRIKLEQHGEELAPDITDEELVLRVWRRWGEQGLPELLGDYAFALWDADARQLWCARDLMGARPFFYAYVGGRFYFSNTLDALRCTREISSELDLHFIGDFLLEGWCPDPTRSAFRDVSRLAPGHLLKYSTDKLSIQRFTSIPIEEPLWLKREEEYVERFRALLEQAVFDRLPQGPVAIFMSGGLDSTTLAAMAVAISEKRGAPPSLRAFTVDYQPLFNDREGRLASLAAEYLRIDINVTSGFPWLPFGNWDHCPPPLPEPCHEPLEALSLKLSRNAAQHGRVAFTGYGGDGVMTGQSWPFLRTLFQDRRWKTIYTCLGSYFLKHGRIPPLRGGFRAKLRRWLNRSECSAKYPSWLATDFEHRLRLQERWRDLQQTRKPEHPWYPDAYRTLTGACWAGILESDDAAWIGRPLESRAPLLDSRILRFLLRVPPVPLCIDKDLLRRATKNLLPEEIRLRRKTPLQGDPIALHVRTGAWKPVPIPEPNAKVQAFVSWKNLTRTLQTEPTEFPWTNLRPISLLYWLRGVEKDQSIQ